MPRVSTDLKDFRFSFVSYQKQSQPIYELIIVGSNFSEQEKRKHEILVEKSAPPFRIKANLSKNTEALDSIKGLVWNWPLENYDEDGRRTTLYPD